MYYDSFASRTGPAAMPSPRSRIAPYFSGRRETFDDFLEEFEARAYDCRLTDSQQVDALVLYVDPSLRETCKSMNGYQSCDWHQFRRSLLHVFSTSPQVMKQKLRDFVKDSSRNRMGREDDVFQYYQMFQYYSDSLVRSGCLAKEDRDIDFWYGFHPHDRDVLWPRLLASYPFQPHDIPFHYEDIYDCAWRVFAYKERPSFWSREQEIESRRTYHGSPSLTSDPRLSSSCTTSFSETQYTPAPSVTKVQPEPEPEPELMPSITPTSPPAPSIAPSCTNVVPEYESKTILPTSPSLPLALSLQSSCMDVVPEPESISEQASLYSFPSTSSSLSIPSLPALCTDAVTEPENTPSTLPMSPILPSNVPTPLPLPSSSPLAPSISFSNSTDIECYEQPEPEPESEPEHSESPSLNSDAPLPSTIDSPASNELPPMPFLFTHASCEPGSSPASAADFFSLGRSESSSESCETIPFPPSPLEVSIVPVPPHSSTLQARSQERTLGVTPNEVTPLAVTSTPPSAIARLVLPASRSLSDLSHALSPPFSTIEVSSSNHDHPSSPGKLVHIIPAPPLEASNVPSTHSSPSQPPYEIVQDDSFSDSLEDSLNIPIPFHLSPSQPPPGFAPIDSFSPSLEVTLVAPTSQVFPSIPQQQLTVTPVDLISSLFEITSAPVSPALPSFEKEQVSSFVTAAVLVFWSKIGSTRISTTMPGNAFDLAQLFRLAQQTARSSRLVFDPGGLGLVEAPHEDVRKRKPKSRDAFINTTFSTVVLATVFLVFDTQIRVFSLVRA